MDGIYDEKLLPCVRESLLYKYSSRIVERTGKMLVAGFQSEDNRYSWNFRRRRVWSPGQGSPAASTQGRHPPRISAARESPAWRSASRWGWSPPTPAPPSPWRARAPGDWWSSQDLRYIFNEIWTCFPVFEANINDHGKHVRCVCTSIILEDLHSTKCAFRDKWRHEKLGEASMYGWKRQTARQILIYLLQKLRPSRRLGLKCQFKYLKLNRRMCQSSEWPSQTCRLGTLTALLWKILT